VALMENFTPIRNGLLAHALVGKLSPFDFGLYVFLIMRADYASGIYDGCAMTIACQFGDPSLKEHVQKALRRLRDKKYVNHRNGDGSRGAYKILINKFFVTVGELSGQRLNAWKHNGLVQPEYEPWNSGDTVTPLSWHGGDTVVAPNKDLKTKDVKIKPISASSKKTLLPEDFTISESMRKWAERHNHTRLEEHLEHFIGYAKANGKIYADWDQAFRNAIRDNWAKLKESQPPVKLPAAYVSASERELARRSASAGGAL
jgi:hypothetical protein